MDTEKDKIKFIKVFTEVRHTSSLLYSDISKLNQLVTLFKKDFKDITFDKNKNNIQLKNFNKKTIISFYNNRIVVDIDEPDYKYFKDIAKKAVTSYNNYFETEPFNRIGFRFHWGIKFASLQEANDIFINSFFDILQKISITNLGTIETGKVELILSQEDKKYGIFINPTTVQNIEIHGSNIKEKVFDALLIDVDLYKDDSISLKDYCNLLNDALNLTRSKVIIIMNQLGVK